MNGKRKVIIATNIAESSITIPDVKYVIDFLMTKDVYYDPVTKNESLVLSWISKANAKQRAGRAGRVADGWVFRMCSENFFKNSVVEYPKPEMQRCPLEKLILQVKLWAAYDPEEVLGRAIQPPCLRDIHNAIKNLQEVGALTYPPGNEMPKLTGLGRIFVNIPVDIRVTRLFLFGMAFKCMHQTVIMGALHAQARSVFRNSFNSDSVGMTKLKAAFDLGRDSDSIMLLDIFEQWVKKFHTDFFRREVRRG